MIIGLYDVDFARYQDKIPPNYTLMKYAAYHKKHKDIVKFLPDLKRADFYQKIYYGFKCLKDKYNKLSETNKMLIKFGMCMIVFIIFILICKCCA